MGWVEDLYDTTVGVDTAPFIYLIEEHPKYLDPVAEFFIGVESGRIRAVTSTITLLEVLVQPIRRGRNDLSRQYRQALVNSDGLICEGVSSEIAEEAVRLRADYNLSTPDAIQLATSIQTGATSFVTNDSFLTAVPNLKVLVLDQLI